MKNRTILILIEITVMLFVFSVAAALCLKGFASASLISKSSEELDKAVQIAANAAELLKNSGGDREAAQEALKGALEERSFELIINTESKDPFLSKARVSVFKGGEEIYSLSVAWQEAG